MPWFLTIGHGDHAGYDRTPPDVRDAAHRHDAALVAGGAVSGVLDPPVLVTNTEGAGVVVRDGPFGTTSLPVAGFALVQADSLDDAVAMVSGTPCAVAHGVVEVWPVREP